MVWARRDDGHGVPYAVVRGDRWIREAIIYFDDFFTDLGAALDPRPRADPGGRQRADRPAPLARARPARRSASATSASGSPSTTTWPGSRSAATSVAIGFVAEGTSTIRVGAGGVMLPNHAPLVIAEQFGTLEALYPGRIDLGLGRAPGTDQPTMRALRRDFTSADTFPHGRAGAAGAARRPGARPAHPRRARARARTSRCGSSARACSAPSSRPRSGCRTRSRRTSRPPRSSPRCRSTARRFRPSTQLDAAARDARRQRDRRRHRRGGAQARHLAAALVHRRRVPAPAHAAAAADRLDRGLLAPAREGAAGEHAQLLVHRLAGDRARAGSTASSPSTSRTS